MAWYSRFGVGGGGGVLPVAQAAQAAATTPGPPAVPTLADEFVLQRQYQRKQRLASMRGRASTFLTGPRGIGAGLPTSEIAMALLRAQAEAEPSNPYGTTSLTTDALAANAAAQARKANPPTNPYQRPPGRER